MSVSISVPNLQIDQSVDRDGIAGHPKGLTTLFLTEVWERFSYYGMRALLVLYMTASLVDGGMGFDTAKATMIYGTYTGAVYFMSILGGWLADKVLGARLAVLWGGVIIALGHFCLAVPSTVAFFSGLVLIVLGTGLLKPNVSAMVGGLYASDDPRRDSGFSIFYMGINIGATLGALVAGYLGQNVDWHWGFACAGIGMVLGLILYLSQFGRLSQVGARPGKVVQTDVQAPRQTLTSEEKRRLAVIAILFFFSVLFWTGFEQAGSSFNLFAQRHTRNSLFGIEFPSSWFQSVNSLFILLLVPIF
ncbi:MAG: peptide MFS transporter, partial [Acidobacteriota bacterium]